MRVLVACEYSGTVRDAMIRRGYDALSCDLLPTDVPGPHYQGSVLDILDNSWDLLIAHPPCTYLTNSGVRHLKTDISRWEKLDEGAKFFRMLMECNIPYKALENPIPHKYAVQRIGCKYDQIIQPWQFGHMETKATCFWLDNLPHLIETKNVKEEMMKLSPKERNRIHRLPPSKDRWKLRSTTFFGIAEAIAEQWGSYVAQKIGEQND